jgi:drug/metabolite transporter (DMT)-like permease
MFSKKYLAYFLIFVSVSVYGAYTGVQKQALEIISNPIAFAFYTMVYCSLFTFPLALYEIGKGKTKLTIFKNRKILLPLIAISILSQFFGLLLKLFALSLTTANSVGLIASFSSVILSIYAVIFLKEKLSKDFFFILLLMSFGLILFRYKQGGSFQFGWGELLAFVFISLTSLSNTLAKISMNNKISPYITGFARSFFATPLLGLLTFFTGNFHAHHLFSFWPILTGLIFATRIVTLYAGVNLTRLSNVAVFNVVAPTVTFAYAFVFLHETLQPIQLLGAGVILLGTWRMYVLKKKTRTNKKSA